MKVQIGTCNITVFVEKYELRKQQMIKNFKNEKIEKAKEGFDSKLSRLIGIRILISN